MCYVDRIKINAYLKYGEEYFYKSCHLTADSFEELLLMAKKIGLRYEWIQESRNGTLHFDLTINKRKLALKYGAMELVYGRCNKKL
jgi:hypothetical protein